jgi:DNA-binding transcriptional LysR family regulator
MELIDRIGRRIKLRDLHILLAVAQSGSMGKAAAGLAVSQPVVSKAISELEHALGQRLFDRSPQGVAPTVYGRAILECSVAVFDELRQGVKTLEFLADPTVGELRIGCTEAGAAGFVPAVIDRLSQRYPRIVFNVVTADPATLAEGDLRKRNIELAIGATPGASAGADIALEVLFEDRHVVMAGAGSKWLRRRSIALADLVDEPWILPPLDSVSGRHIADAFRAHGLEPPQSRVLSFSIPLSHHLLGTGRFLAMLPVTMARLGKHLPFKVLDVRFRGIPRTIAIMTLKNRTISPLARLFVDCAREMAKPLAKGRLSMASVPRRSKLERA